jgi:hypothetical protein
MQNREKGLFVSLIKTEKEAKENYARLTGGYAGGYLEDYVHVRATSRVSPKSTS